VFSLRCVPSSLPSKLLICNNSSGRSPLEKCQVYLLNIRRTWTTWSNFVCSRILRWGLAALTSLPKLNYSKIKQASLRSWSRIKRAAPSQTTKKCWSTQSKFLATLARLLTDFLKQTTSPVKSLKLDASSECVATTMFPTWTMSTKELLLHNCKFQGQQDTLPESQEALPISRKLLPEKRTLSLSQLTWEELDRLIPKLERSERMRQRATTMPSSTSVSPDSMAGPMRLTPSMTRTFTSYQSKSTTLSLRFHLPIRWRAGTIYLQLARGLMNTTTFNISRGTIPPAADLDKTELISWTLQLACLLEDRLLVPTDFLLRTLLKIDFILEKQLIWIVVKSISITTRGSSNNRNSSLWVSVLPDLTKLGKDITFQVPTSNRDHLLLGTTPMTSSNPPISPKVLYRNRDTKVQEPVLNLLDQKFKVTTSSNMTSTTWTDGKAVQAEEGPFEC